MSEFHVGQEVVCVDDDLHPEWPANRGASDWVGWPLRVGQHYLIAGMGISDCGNEPTLDLKGVTYGPLAARRFRPIKPDSIAIFREMCVRKLIDVGAE
jgi:hypothetical protein